MDENEVTLPMDRGHELQYSIYIDSEIFPEEEDAVEYINDIMRQLFRTKSGVTDWDGPL